MALRIHFSPFIDQSNRVHRCLGAGVACFVTALRWTGCRTRTQPWRLELTLDNNKTHISQSRPWTSTCGPCVFERKANKQSQRAESVPAVRSVCARVQGCRYPRGVSQRCHVVYRQVLFGILLCIKLASDAQVLRTSVRPNSMDGHAVHEEPPPVDVCSS